MMSIDCGFHSNLSKSKNTLVVMNQYKFTLSYNNLLRVSRQAEYFVKFSDEALFCCCQIVAKQKQMHFIISDLLFR